MSYGVQRAVRVAFGQAISARNTDQYRRAIESINAARLSIRTSAQRPWSESMVHVILGVFGDYIACARLWRNSAVGDATVNVARPKLLRASETDRDGVTYVYTDPQTRTASKAGETDELQIVTPNYLVGDFLEVHVIRGKTGIPEVDAQRGSPIDANVDGRAWAAVPPVTP